MTDDRLFHEFSAVGSALVRHQWRALLNGRTRLDTRFTGYTRIAPPRSFAGSLRQRSDLVAALDAAAAPGDAPRLLIVGQPGFGKTVALIDVAQHLADHHGGRFGVAVVFNLGRWRHHDDDLIRWMVRGLCASTGPMPGADDLVMQWVTAGWIAPMLDGLDEITDDDSRHRCVMAINTFIDRSPRWTAVVVASRPDEYTTITAQGADRLAVNAAIELRELRRSLVAGRLRNTGPGGNERLADLVENAPTHPLVETLRIPLWLSLAATLDQTDTEKLTTTSSREAAQAVLTDAHLVRSIATLDRRVHLGPTTCRRMLAAIAGFLAHPHSPDSTTFRFEDLTPPHPAQKHASAAGLASGLAVAAVAGLLFLRVGSGVLAGSVGGLLFGLITGLAFGVASGLFCGQITGRAPDGQPKRARVQWAGSHEVHLPLVRGLGFGVLSFLVSGFAFGLVGELVLRLSGPEPGLHDAFHTGIHSGLTIGLGVGASELIDTFVANRVASGERLDEGRSDSRASVGLHLAVFVLGVGFPVGLAVTHAGGLAIGPGVGLAFGLVMGMMSGANNGGWYLVMQRSLRRRADQQDLLPRDAVTFVREAAEVGILRQTSGGVQFRHRLLADRLTEEAPTPVLMDLRRSVGRDIVHGGPNRDSEQP